MNIFKIRRIHGIYPQSEWAQGIHAKNQYLPHAKTKRNYNEKDVNHNKKYTPL